MVLTVLGSFLRQSSFVFTNVTSALEVFLNDMRYINPCFTYLLIYCCAAIYAAAAVLLLVLPPPLQHYYCSTTTTATVYITTTTTTTTKCSHFLVLHTQPTHFSADIYDK